jgi:hypothetical protein
LDLEDIMMSLDLELTPLSEESHTNVNDAVTSLDKCEGRMDVAKFTHIPSVCTWLFGFLHSEMSPIPSIP